MGKRQEADPTVRGEAANGRLDRLSTLEAAARHQGLQRFHQEFFPRRVRSVGAHALPLVEGLRTHHLTDKEPEMFRRLFTSSRKPTRRSRNARIGVESLGDRVVPAVTASLSAGVLTLTSDAANDQVNVKPGTTAGQVEVLSGQASLGTFSSVSRMEFYGNAGNDYFRNLTSLACKAWGGDGNDVLIGGGGNDVLWAGNGDDWLDGRDGDDSLYGQGGNDSLIGGKGSDTLSDQYGTNELFDDALDARSDAERRLSASLKTTFQSVRTASYQVQSEALRGTMKQWLTSLLTGDPITGATDSLWDTARFRINPNAIDTTSSSAYTDQLMTRLIQSLKSVSPVYNGVAVSHVVNYCFAVGGITDLLGQGVSSTSTQLDYESSYESSV